VPADPQEDQDQVLAWEMAAFPAEDEPDWDALEYLEYFGDTQPVEKPWPEDLPAPVPGTPAAATPAEGDARRLADGRVGGQAHRRAVSNDQAGSNDGDHANSSGTAAVTPAADHADGGDTAAGLVATGAGFAQGGVADVMPPGPVLAGLADRASQGGLGRLDDDELIGVLSAWQRLGAWAAAGLLSATSELVARREAEGRATGDGRMLEHVVDEVALALTLTGYSAGRVLGLALALNRLPLTRTALAAGRIDERRAALIADELSGLDDEHAAAVEASVIGDAPGLTTGELRPVLRRAVIAVDPAAARRRKEQALKDARVEVYSEPSGTASLAGRDLRPAEVLAADKNLTALAMDMKNAGTPGTMDQLRALAYLHLLSGQPAETLFTTGQDSPGSPGTGTTGAPGTPGATGPSDAGPPSTSTTGAPGTPGTGTAGDGTAGPGTAGMTAPGRGPRSLRGSVNLTMPLETWLGWSQSPGQVPGFGTIDSDDSRALAARLAAYPGNQWCITLTDRAGYAVAHGCSTTGPGPYPEPDPGPAPRAGPGPSPGPGPAP
jgi:hypothetical protein